MISYLKGKVLHKASTSAVILAGNIGYEVILTANKLLQLVPAQEVELYTYLHVREDAVQLYGFENWEEREFFLLLLNVSGVGPKVAMTILGQSTINGLHRAIAEENIAFLTKVPGIGKKTAQRLVLELKDKLPEESFAFLASEDSEPQTRAETGAAKNDIYAVLLTLGYHESEIRTIYPQLKEVIAQGDEQAVIKKALQLLAKF